MSDKDWTLDECVDLLEVYDSERETNPFAVPTTTLYDLAAALRAAVERVGELEAVVAARDHELMCVRNSYGDLYESAEAAERALAEALDKRNAESEELRHRIEETLEGWPDNEEELLDVAIRGVLDRVDAGHSLAYLERLREAERERDEARAERRRAWDALRRLDAIYRADIETDGPYGDRPAWLLSALHDADEHDKRATKPAGDGEEG